MIKLDPKRESNSCLKNYLNTLVLEKKIGLLASKSRFLVKLVASFQSEVS